jgi:hypothetical protein
MTGLSLKKKGQSEMAKAVATIERKIFFYRLKVLPLEDGSTPPFSLADMLTKLKALKYLKDNTGPTSNYMSSGRAVIAAWPEVEVERIEVGRVRRDDWPSLENAGKRKPIPTVDGDGVSESCHIAFYAKNIVGAEFNFYAPRASVISDYCAEKAPTIPRFKLYPLLNRDAIAQLNEMRDVRLLSLRVHRSHSELLKKADASIASAFESVSQQFDAETFELTIRAKRGETLAQSLIAKAKAMLKSSKNPAQDFEMFRVRGLSENTDHVEEFDLLKDRFISKADVIKQSNNRGVQSESMYSAIDVAYNELKMDLEKASALGLD